MWTPHGILTENGSPKRTCKCVCIACRVVVLAHSHHSFTGDQIRCSSPEPREPATGSCWPCQVDEPPAMQQQHQTSAIPPNQQIKILVETRSVRQNKLKHSTARWFSAGGIQVHTAHSLAPTHARRTPEDMAPELAHRYTTTKIIINRIGCIMRWLSYIEALVPCCRIVQRFHADVGHIGAADALHREFKATG